jgi:hypothetical protein
VKSGEKSRGNPVAGTTLEKKVAETQSPARLWRKKSRKLSRRHDFGEKSRGNSVAGISFLKELKKTQSPAFIS